MSEGNNWDMSLAGFYENEGDFGIFYNSPKLDAETIERFTSNLREGGKLKFRILSDDKRKKIAAYLDFVSPEKVQANAKKFGNQSRKEDL